MILWALIIVVTLKYVLVLLRADNNGEGGTLSLTALATRALGRRRRVCCCSASSARRCSSATRSITPAISVLSAVEGLKLATPALRSTTCAAHDRDPDRAVRGAAPRHRAASPAFFGPVMVVWFVAIAVAGAMHIARRSAVFAAINPLYAISFVRRTATIGAGHARRGVPRRHRRRGALCRPRPFRPASRSRCAWLGLVLPALLINYFGQGALVLAHPEAIENPFYRLVPEALLLPMVVLATAATVIASQAVITGAYSLVRQAIQLGLLPRLAIVHTSAEHSGQIYHAAGQHGAADRRAAAGRPVPHLERARLGLWHRRRHHDGGRRRARLHRDLEAVELAGLEGGAADGAAGDRRCDVLLAPTCSSCSKAHGCRCCSAPAW